MAKVVLWLNDNAWTGIVLLCVLSVCIYSGVFAAIFADTDLSFLVTLFVLPIRFLATLLTTYFLIMLVLFYWEKPAVQARWHQLIKWAQKNAA